MAEEVEFGYWFSPHHHADSLIHRERSGIEEKMRRVIIEEGRKLGLPWDVIEEAYYYFLKLHRLKNLLNSSDE
ncbi:MAG: hypothetical protein DRJ38_04070 [Thermoprotei archaeon]|nr:MAG: hypothetical protein DRJ38_04070 [Thermoprotei archaeon]